jgi:hypothetical protein
MSNLKEENFLEGLKRLKIFFDLLDKHYPVFKQNDLEEKKAEAKKARGHLEMLCKDWKEICERSKNVCEPNILKLQRHLPQELLKNICNRIGEDKFDPNTEPMKSQATPGSDKSET